MPRTNADIAEPIAKHLEAYTDELGQKILCEKSDRARINLLRLLRLVFILDDAYPHLKSEADLVAALPLCHCHELYEETVLPEAIQQNTTERQIRQYIRTLRVAWKFPIVSFTHKKGEPIDPLAPQNGRRFGYRWAKDLKDLRDYKDRIRPEIREHMLAQMERYEAMDDMEAEIFGTWDNFYHKLAIEVAKLKPDDSDSSLAL